MSAVIKAGLNFLEQVAEEGMGVLRAKDLFSYEGIEDDIVKSIIRHSKFDLEESAGQLTHLQKSKIDNEEFYNKSISYYKERSFENLNKKLDEATSNLPQNAGPFDPHLATINNLEDEVKFRLSNLYDYKSKDPSYNYPSDGVASKVRKGTFSHEEEIEYRKELLKVNDPNLSESEAYNVATHLENPHPVSSTPFDIGEKENLIRRNEKREVVEFPENINGETYYHQFELGYRNDAGESVGVLSYSSKTDDILDIYGQPVVKDDPRLNDIEENIFFTYPKNYKSEINPNPNPFTVNNNVNDLFEQKPLKHPGPLIGEFNPNPGTSQPLTPPTPPQTPVTTQQAIPQPAPVAPQPVAQPTTAVNQTATQQTKAAEVEHPFFITLKDNKFDSDAYQKKYYKDVKAGSYEQEVSNAYLGNYKDKDLFGIEVNPSNFNITSTEGNVNQFGETLQKVVERHTKAAASQDAPAINKLLSNPILDDESFKAFNKQYAANKGAGLNPIAAASHNIGRMKEKSQSVLGNMLEQESGSTSALYKIAATGAVGAGIGYAMYDNPTEGAMMGVMGGAVGAGAMKALALNSEGIQNSMMKSLLKDKFKPGASSDALNENFEAVTKLNKEDLGFVDNYYKDTLTKNFGTASMGLQSRTMIMSGAALAGVAFTGNKKDKRRGFNANRGNRI